MKRSAGLDRRRPALAALAVALTLAGASSAAAQVRVSTGGGQFNVGVMSMRDVPFRTVVRQQYDYSCGSAALATLLRYHYGVSVTEADLFSAMFAAGDQGKIRKLGFSLLDMKAYLSSRGYASSGYRATLDQLQRSGMPAIAMMSLNGYRHFVVIKGVSAKEVLVGDPTLGLKRYPRDEFSRAWNGVAFVIDARPAQAKAQFNRADEWRPWASVALGDPMADRSLAALTRDLPPVYQVVLPTPGFTP